jgi:hypothetical protein
MSKLKAIIKEGIVHQIIVATDEHTATLPETIIDVTDIECAIGWEYDGINLTAPTVEEESNGRVVAALTELLTDEEHSLRLIEAAEKAGQTVEEYQLQWRNAELELTDKFVPITDHPNHAEILEFRTKLRDWPSTDTFPKVRPAPLSDSIPPKV